MSVLDTLKRGLTNQAPLLPVAESMNHGVHGPSLVGFGVDKAERIIASGGFGFIKGYFRQRGLIGGVVPVDILAGTALTLLSAGLYMASDGKSAFAQHCERIGDAGVQSFFNSLGASWGAEAAGYQVAVVPGKKLPPGAAPLVLGALSPAADGAYLTAEEIAHYSVPKK